MAVEKRWIKITMVTIALILLFFVLTQLAVTATVNALLGSIYSSAVLLNSSVELVSLALFIVPAIWLALAAAISRHRGVYILHTVVTGLAFLTVLGLIVYEAVTFGSVLGLYKQSAGSLVQGLMITKLVLWSIIAVLVIIFLSISISAQCVRRNPDKYGQQYSRQSTMPMPYYPTMDYGRPLQTKSSPRDYPRLTAPPPMTRYQDYPSSPRAYYPPRY